MRLSHYASLLSPVSLAVAMNIPVLPPLAQRQETTSSSILSSLSSAVSSATSAISSATSAASSASSSAASSATSASTSSSTSSASSSTSATDSGSVVGTPTTAAYTTVTATPAASPSAVPAPVGGIGLNNTPTYKPQSDYDFQSLNLGLHQELIELDLFHYGLARFSMEEFQEAGLSEEDMYLIQFMAEQEVGHATIFENFLYPNVTEQCQYTYPNFTNVMDWVDFSMKLTRWGESGTFGFLAHLDAQDVASLVFDAIATEARQQMVFRQFEGQFPMPFWFIPSITQSMQWTLLAPYIASCPEGTPEVKWTNWPALTVLNNPYLPDLGSTPNITTNNTQVTYAGRQVNISWEQPGQTVGYNGSFTTNSTAGTPMYAAWISQLNTTYTLLENVDASSGNYTNATTVQPGGQLFDNTSYFDFAPNGTFPLLNGTVYLLITDAAPYVTPYNLSQLEPHIVAGPALYQVG